MSDHSRFSPSSANRWVVCQHSLVPVDVHYAREEEDTEYSRDGSAKHKLSEWALGGECDPVDAMLMEMSFHGLQVTTDMVEAADVYVNHVRAILSNPAWHLLDLESRVHMPQIHDDMYGTLDVALLNEAEKHLIIGDAKFGWEIVEAEDNWQGRAYAIGKVSELEDMGYEIDTVSFFICQPADKDQPIKTVHYVRADLKKFARVMKAATKGNAIKAGTHCKYCPRAVVPGLCPELERHAQEIHDEINHATADGQRSIDAGVAEYTDERLAELLAMQSVVKIFFAAVANMARQSIILGGNIEGYEVREGQGNRRYKDPNQAEKLLFDKFGEGIYEPRALRSPAQIETVWPRAKVYMNGNGKDIEPLTERPRTGLTLRKKDER